MELDAQAKIRKKKRVLGELTLLSNSDFFLKAQNIFLPLGVKKT